MSFLKKKGVRSWLITSASLLAVFTTVSLVATQVKDFYELLNTALPGGGPRPIYKEGIEPNYTGKYNSKKDVHAAARDTNEKICEEGMILLKNKNNALPIKTSKSGGESNPKVTVFGKNSVNIAFGGSGSGGANTSNATSLNDGLRAEGFDVNPTVEKFYKDDAKSGAARKAGSKDLDSGDTTVLSTAETPQDKYTEEVKRSYTEYSDAAIIVITRIGGEGFDMPRVMTGSTGYRNEDDHFLQLDANEEDLVESVCKAGFSKVILLLNTGTPIEVGFLEKGTNYVTKKGYSIDPDKIDAALWIGYPGESGTTAVGKIINGSVNPSGRTADTYSVDFKEDPTWFNFGDNRITANKNKGIIGGDQYVFDVPENEQPEVPYYFVSYEEGIYVGYRYYETRGKNDADWYANHVVYPFGYGLSYTNFEWTLQDASEIKDVAIEKDHTYNIQVNIKNTGEIAGKDVVEIYGHAPYTKGGIEKAEEQLLAYGKTDLLEPGEEQTLTLEINPYYLASFDYKDKNKNGFKTFELDKGNGYELYVAHNAHDHEFSIPFSVTEDIIYDKDTVTGENDVTTRFTDCEDARFNSDTGLGSILSRSDWDGTFPVSPTEDERKGSKELLGWLQDKSDNNPNNYDDEDMPASEEENGLVLRDLLPEDKKPNQDSYVDYDDERWDTLINEMSIADMANIYNYGSYHIEASSTIGLPRINCADGPVGWACFMDTSRFYDTCSYVCETLVTTTWNDEMAEEFGEMVGEEGLVGDAKNATPYTGWYAPAMNIHRSPFGGRNFEYYSEDPLLSGKIGAAQIRGCNSKGVFTFVKHFAANEQETHRSISGDISWVNEQALREIYLRQFEIAVKEGHSRAVMSSFNRIGTRWTGGDYRLLTDILRNEWGFKGVVLCDFNTIPSYMISRQMAYAGGDINLAIQPVSWVDESSVSDVIVLRKCIKNILYAVVNSNAMNGVVIGYKLPYWVICVIIIDAVVVVAIAVWGFFVIHRALKPEPVAKDKEKTQN